MEKTVLLHPVLTLLLVSAGFYILDGIIHLVFPILKLVTIFVLVRLFVRRENRDELIRLVASSHQSQRLPSLLIPFPSFRESKELLIKCFKHQTARFSWMMQESGTLGSFESVAT